MYGINSCGTHERISDYGLRKLLGIRTSPLQPSKFVRSPVKDTYMKRKLTFKDNESKKVKSAVGIVLGAIGGVVLVSALIKGAGMAGAKAKNSACGFFDKLKSRFKLKK